MLCLIFQQTALQQQEEELAVRHQAEVEEIYANLVGVSFMGSNVTSKEAAHDKETSLMIDMAVKEERENIVKKLRFSQQQPLHRSQAQC